jgi:protein gp37
MKNSGISWCDHSHSWWLGCTKISPGCDECYAEDEEQDRFKRVKWGNHPRIRTSPPYWRKPVAWNREAARLGIRYRVFANHLSDFFDNRAHPDWREEAWDYTRDCRYLGWLLLTKRIQNVPGMLPFDWRGGWNHVTLGVSVENQTEADRRIPLLLEVPAVQRMVSVEPMLGPVNLRPWLGSLDWVIIGGESGRHRREMDPMWARDLRHQCLDGGVAVFVKQMSAINPKVGAALIPDDLRVQQFPVNRRSTRAA